MDHKQLRDELRHERDRLIDLAAKLEAIDNDAAHEANRDVRNAASQLFAAWSKLYNDEKPLEPRGVYHHETRGTQPVSAEYHRKIISGEIDIEDGGIHRIF